MKQFPIILSAKILLAVALLLALLVYAVIPAFVYVKDKSTAIWSFYSGSAQEASMQLEKERAALLELEKRVLPQTDPIKKGAAYYDFLQETLKKHNVPASKINSGEQISSNNVKREDYSLKFTGTYHTIGLLVNDLENGTYFCMVKSLHVVSKSLLDNTLEADMSAFFYRLER
jgi:Tfp pilus assembly protein PilO